MKKSTKILSVVLSLVLVAALSIGGTAAWLTAKTEAVKNTFSFGDIDITLTESRELDLKVVPGKVITKDPVATVVGGSEPCWLFVELNKVNWLDELTYDLAEGWTKGDGDKIPANVIYREVTGNTEDQEFHVLLNDQVKVSGDLTKQQIAAAKENPPQLNLTAYAVQKDGFGTAALAWAEVAPTQD